MATIIAPYGSWKSPITSDVVIEESISLMEVKIDPFQEGRPFFPVILKGANIRWRVLYMLESKQFEISITVSKRYTRSALRDIVERRTLLRILNRLFGGL